MIHNTWCWRLVNQAVKQSFPKKHFQHKQNCLNVVQKKLFTWFWTGEASIQKLRVLVTSWEITLSNCKNLAIVYQKQIEQRKILTSHCENAFSPVGISDYQSYGYEGFGKTCKFLPWLLSTQNKLLASALGKLSICCEASAKKCFGPSSFRRTIASPRLLSAIWVDASLL